MSEGFDMGIFNDYDYVIHLHPDVKNDIKYTFIKRFDNDNYEPRRIDDNLKLYHEHDMKNIIQLLKDRNIYSP